MRKGRRGPKELAELDRCFERVRALLVEVRAGKEVDVEGEMEALVEEMECVEWRIMELVERAELVEVANG